ncbi:MAG: nucleoside kinase, partial [Lachnospiraceae bacterium]|nr:nucleoside kinase [Lachnospiraceae bacterium]
MKPVRGVFGDADVTIGNSLNQGYYSYINLDGAKLTTSDINKIRTRMEKIIAHDTEIIIENDTVGHAMEKWVSLGYPEKARLLEGRPRD